jgi:addiction module HigA family antidote
MLSVSQAARDLGISRQTLHRILDGGTAITPEMATRLGVLAGLPPIFWLRIQCEYDLQRAHVSLADALLRIPRRTLPHKIMKELGALNGR